MIGLAGLALTSRVPIAQARQNLVLDDNFNIAIPEGCKLRLVAQSSRPVLSSASYRWHPAPDGGACFTTADKGWIYVSNSEIANKGGGAGAIRFDASGDIIDAYPLLSGTSRNCAGGKTPWQSWLSCEENGDLGLVYECDPAGRQKAQVRPLLGSFNHEAVAIDPVSSVCYMTEDVRDGCLYRFIPETKHDLSKGKLEVAVIDRHVLSWMPVNDPSAQQTPTRYQVKNAARFKGGEGIVYFERQVFFTTKIDNVVWCYHLDTHVLTKVYDAADFASPVLTGVDNIEVSSSGELFIAEDGGNMQIVALDQAYQPTVLLQVYGQDKSEITGPAFSPDGSRLYFSSQRGKTGSSEDGLTYELRLS